jgi:hypothetical protein
MTNDEMKSRLPNLLISQGEPSLTAEEEQRLLRSLDEAARDIDAGKGVPLEEVRKRVASWVVK